MRGKTTSKADLLCNAKYLGLIYGQQHDDLRCFGGSAEEASDMELPSCASGMVGCRYA